MSAGGKAPILGALAAAALFGASTPAAKALVGEIGTNSRSFTPDSGELNAVALPKVELADRPACKRTSRVECGVHERQALRLECGDIGWDLGVDLEFLSNHIEASFLVTGDELRDAAEAGFERWSEICRLLSLPNWP